MTEARKGFTRLRSKAKNATAAAEIHVRLADPFKPRQSIEEPNHN